MKNKIDLVNDAFSMLLRTGVTVQATNADIELALGRLEDVMAELESRNLATGYNFENPPQPDSPSGLEDYMNLAVSRLLAVNVWPDFSPEAVNQMLLTQSAQSQSNLSARLAQQSMLKYAKRMPLGSGNQPYQQYQKFYGDYSSDCGTGCAIPAAAPVPPPFDSDAIVVDNLKLLASESTSEAAGKAFFVNSFYAGWSTPSGGGWFVWSALESKANHDGVTVYAPEALAAWSGSQSDIATMLNWSGAGSGCWLRSDLQGFVTPEMAGAKRDGIANDTASFKSAIEFLAAIGGGLLQCGLGTYLLSNSDAGWSHWDNKAAIKVLSDNIHIKGLGAGATVIKVADGADCHAVKFGDRILTTPIVVKNCSVSNLSIDGNRANQLTPEQFEYHWGGVDVASGCESIVVSNLHVYQTQYYGIGYQTRNFKNCHVKDCLIEDTGADGLDWKDDLGTNNGNSVSNVTVRRFGLVSNTILPEQAGVDLRGGIMASRIYVEGVNSDRKGIRFSTGTNVNPSYGPLTDFRVIASSKDTCTGLDIGSFSTAISPCNFSQGSVTGASIGIDVRSQQHRLSNIDAINCGRGFQVLRNTQLVNCLSQGSSEFGYNIRNIRNSLINCNAISNAVGLNVEATSTLSSVRGGIFDLNTTNVVDAGVQTDISKVNGIRTDSYGTGTFDVASTGLKTLSISHNLDFPPIIELTTATVIRETSVNDYELALVRINAVDANLVNVSVMVKVASAAAGAIARLSVRAITKKALRA